MMPREEHFLFYYELGLALSQWAKLEMALCDVLVCCVSKQERRKLSVGFYAIENFRSKLSFADDVLAETFDQNPLLEKWSKIKSSIEKCAKKRNKVAHRNVVTYAASPPGRQIALVDWQAEQFTAKAKQRSFLSNRSPPEGALCLIDIVHIRYDFFGVMIELANLAAELSDTALPYPPESFQQSKPPSFAEYREQMRALVSANQ